MSRNASKRHARYARHRPTGQSFPVCKVNLATLNVATRGERERQGFPLESDLFHVLLFLRNPLLLTDGCRGQCCHKATSAMSPNQLRHERMTIEMVLAECCSFGQSGARTRVKGDEV